MDRAEARTKKSEFPAAIRLYEDALKLALRSGEDEIAKEIGNKIQELFKLIPKPTKKKKKGKGKGGKGAAGKKRGQSRDQYQKEVEDQRKETMKIQKQMDEFVQKAETALEQQDFKASAKFYAEAANLAKNVGDKDKVVQFAAQAEELKKIADEIDQSRKGK